LCAINCPLSVLMLRTAGTFSTDIPRCHLRQISGSGWDQGFHLSFWPTNCRLTFVLAGWDLLLAGWDLHACHLG
jgi:hypothetical protein